MRKNSTAPWLLSLFESPDHISSPFGEMGSLFNWTWSYRMDSEVFIPHLKFIPTKLDLGNWEPGSQAANALL